MSDEESSPEFDAVSERGGASTIVTVDGEAGNGAIALVAAVPYGTTQDELDAALDELEAVLDDEPNVCLRSPRDRRLRADGGTPSIESDGDEAYISVSVELTRPVAAQVVAASQLLDQTPGEFIDDAVLGRLQSIDNVLHGEPHIDLPPDFDADAWRDRYENIRRLETLDGTGGDGL